MLTLQGLASHCGNHLFWYNVNYLLKKPKALIEGQTIV